LVGLVFNKVLDILISSRQKAVRQLYTTEESTDLESSYIVSNRLIDYLSKQVSL